MRAAEVDIRVLPYHEYVQEGGALKSLRMIGGICSLVAHEMNQNIITLWIMDLIGLPIFFTGVLRNTAVMINSRPNN